MNRQVPIGRRVTVEVPATSANLGPGFDSLGLALDWRDRCSVTVTAEPEVRVEVSGEGAAGLPADGDNLIARCLQRGLERLEMTATGLLIRVHNTIPQGRGLGSSSAAIVAGLAAAHGLARPEETFEPRDWLGAADEIEGHPDNVAAALLGGLAVAFRDGAGVHAVRAAIGDRVRALALVPDSRLATSVARATLPDRIAHRDAAVNSGRVALLLHALAAEPELLLPATEDLLHQSYRASAMPASARLLAELRARGLPAVISGAGPTVLVLGTAETVDRAAEVAPADFAAIRCRVGDGVSVLTGVAV